ncbi:MAG: NAD(P)/FAD-dependent oxidoreductase [Pyrinomonadaceae bacterium]
MKVYDAAIVGAGIVGAACAAALAREGLKVIVIDANDPATGVTAAGMGHIVAMDDSEAQFALTNYSRELWKQLANELPPECEYEQCGTIWVAADETEMDEVRRKQTYYAKNGIRSERLDAKSLREAEPNLATGLAGGLLVEGDSVVYQIGANRYLIDKAIDRGAELRIGSPATRIFEGGVDLANGETINAGHVINAAGSSAAALSPQLRIVKRKGHLVITERYAGFIRRQLIELGYLRSAHGRAADSVAFNVQPRKTGQLLLGSSRQFGVETNEVDPRIVRRMAERAFEYMPRLRKLSVIRTWTGFRPATPDNLPYIGKIPGFEKVYAAAGHEGLGITTSLGTAELLAAEILDRLPPISPEPYSPSRSITEH